MTTCSLNHSLFNQERFNLTGTGPDEVVSSLVLWKPLPNGTIRRNLTFPDVISRDSGISKQDLGTAMADRENWRRIVKSIVSTAVEE